MVQYKIQLKLITPVKALYDQAVDQVIVPTQVGQITVLPEHSYLVSILKPGELIVKDGANEFPVAVAGGVIEVFDNNLVILADSAEHVTEIDAAHAEAEAKKLAELLKEAAQENVAEYTAMEQMLAYHQVRTELIKKWRRN